MFPSSLKNRKSKRNSDFGQESEIETLQNALQEAMLRERQLIQEKAQREDEMKQRRDSTKQCIEVLMREKSELVEKLKKIAPTTTTTTTTVLQKPPPVPNSRSKSSNYKEDLERVLQKLSQREYEHNQFNEEILKLRLENNQYKKDLQMIEKTYRITKDKLLTAQEKIETANENTKQFHNTQTLLQLITNELKETQTLQLITNEKNKILSQEKENLKDELNKINKTNNNKKQKIDLLNNELNKYKSTNIELRNKFDQLTTKGKIQIDELINENEMKQNEIIKANQTIHKTNHSLNLNEIKYNNLLTQYDNKMNEFKNEIEEINNNQIIGKNKLLQQINESQIEYKIKEKKRNKLIKELQEQLKKEIIKSQELKCEVLKLNDDKNKNQNENENENKNNVSVSNALVKKLEIEIKSNYSLKEQIKYLTESIQQLHIDLDNKKTTITNLIKRIDIGALPTNKTNKINKSNNIISQLQLLMQETTLQNAMLRQDLKLMGKELNNKIQTIKNLQNQKAID